MSQSGVNRKLKILTRRDSDWHVCFRSPTYSSLHFVTFKQVAYRVGLFFGFLTALKGPSNLSKWTFLNPHETIPNGLPSQIA